MYRRLALCVPFLHQTTLTSETLNSSDDINVCSIKTVNVRITEFEFFETERKVVNSTNQDL